MWCENRTTFLQLFELETESFRSTDTCHHFLYEKKDVKIQIHTECAIFYGRFSEHRMRMQCHLGSAERPTAALSNPHLSSKAAKRRASRMFSSGSQVLYLYHKNEGEEGGVRLLT